ncbi:hypothetical protein HYU06_06110 [Candidatus Woesearchaeota archaeon]|nr:hypothetical protein [Candidatus Woesearchaeota archaeon]
MKKGVRVDKLNRIMVLLVLIVFLLILTGCREGTGLFSGKNPKQDTAVARERIYTGTEGLVIRFMPNLPPAEIYDTASIQIIAEVRNKGTDKIETAKFYLSGYDTGIIQNIDNFKELNNLEPKSEFLPDGGYDTVSFGSFGNIRVPKGADEYNPRFVLSSCYDYKTLATPIVCIDPNKQNPAIKEKGACQMQSVSVGGTGAPVAVDRVSLDSTIDRAFVRIEISNVGKGQVLSNNAIGQKCPYKLGFEDLDEITYSITLSGIPPTKCSPDLGKQGKPAIKLGDGRAIITCEFPVARENRFAYSTPLQIELNYGYTESIYTDVRIINTGVAK